MGLTDEEMAFYDALTRPEAIKDFYTNDQLVAITRELTEALRNPKSTAHASISKRSATEMWFMMWWTVIRLCLKK